MSCFFTPGDFPLARDFAIGKIWRRSCFRLLRQTRRRWHKFCVAPQSQTAAPVLHAESCMQPVLQTFRAPRSASTHHAHRQHRNHSDNHHDVRMTAMPSTCLCCCCCHCWRTDCRSPQLILWSRCCKRGTAGGRRWSQLLASLLPAVAE